RLERLQGRLIAKYGRNRRRQIKDRGVRAPGCAAEYGVGLVQGALNLETLPRHTRTPVQLRHQIPGEQHNYFRLGAGRCQQVLPERVEWQETRLPRAAPLCRSGLQVQLDRLGRPRCRKQEGQRWATAELRNNAFCFEKIHVARTPMLPEANT